MPTTGTMAFQLPLPGSSKPLRPLQAGRGDQQQPQQQPQPSRRRVPLPPFDRLT